MVRGSIIKRGQNYYWKHKKADGKYTLTVVRDETGLPVGDRQRATAIVERSQAELQHIDNLQSKAEYLVQVAEFKKLIAPCKTAITNLEEAYFSHPARAEVSPRYEQNYRTAIRHLVAFLNAHHPEVSLLPEVSEEIAGEYLSSYWKTGVSGKTYNGRLDTLRVVFRLFRKTDNPFQEFPKRAVQQEQRNAFTLDELSRIWALLNDDSYYMLHKAEMRLLCLLALNTGARCGDLCRLKWDNINLVKLVINFTPSKTKNSSKVVLAVPMNVVVAEALQRWERTSDYLLPNVADRYCRNPDGIYSDTIKLLEAAGIQTKSAPSSRRQRRVVQYSFHSFRHTCASLMVEYGASQTTVARLLGHSSLQTTNRYVHIPDSGKQNAIQLLPPVMTPITPMPTEESFHATISRIVSKYSGRLATWLTDNLTPDQKQQLLVELSLKTIGHL